MLKAGLRFDHNKNPNIVNYLIEYSLQEIKEKDHELE